MKGRRQCDPISGCGKFYDQNATQCPHCKASDAFSAVLPFNPLDWVYDLETYPNVFTASFKHLNSGTRLMFEISDRMNQAAELYDFLLNLNKTGCRLVGFNNNGFDYPVLHFFIDNFPHYRTAADLYSKAAAIIATPWHNRFDNVVWDNDVLITQIDLYKIHHFDNEARRTSLKMLEFNMRSESIEDLPYEPGYPLTVEQIPVLLDYNDHDVDETGKFYIETIPMIEFRETLSEKYGRNFLNHNDTKIGKDYFIMELERLIPGSCYTRDAGGKRAPRQTIRQSINLANVIFPYINFKEPHFERIKDWLASQVITETKGVFKDLIASINGFNYVFGAGGIHGSIDSGIVYSDDDFELWDWDVASYYPNIAIANRLYPEHLSEQFCDIYKDVFEQRRQFKKGTPENAMLKLALNGVYGDSNNRYSPFYDSKYTMSITINGQLLLCMLAQYLIDIPGLQMIQINTDGLTVRCPRGHIETMKTICKWWEDYTCLELESAVYSRMMIRDVNNYIGEYKSDDGKLCPCGCGVATGKVKRKGAYEYKLAWHQNHSALVVPRAAEAALVHGADIREFITNHADIMDFMLRTKVGRSDALILTDTKGNETRMQNITRYYISNAPGAGSLTKISPPAKGAKIGSWKRKNSLTDQFYQSVIAELRGQNVTDTALLGGVPHDLDTNGLPWDDRINTANRSKYDTRRTGINTGWLVNPCNNIKDANRENINFDYYIAEAEKLVKPLRG